MDEPSPTSADPGPAPARAGAEIGGWLAAGARAVALLAPAGAGRSLAFDAVASAAAGRFAVTRLAAKEGEAAESIVVRADAAARRAAGGPALLLLEDGEVLSPAEARSLRGLADHAPGDLRLAVGLAPTAASADVLRALGPGLERVSLGGVSAPRAAPPPVSPKRATAAVLALAAGSIAASLALLVPRFRDPPGAARAPTAPPAVSAAPAPAIAPTAPPAVSAAPAPPIAPFAPPAPTASSVDRATAPVPGAGEAPAPARGSAPQRPPPHPRTGAPSAPSPARAASTPGVAAAPTRAAPGAPVRPPGGYLFVNAIPRARITVNGAPAGATPVVRFPLSRGQHRVVADFGDGSSEERRIEAVGSETYVVFGGSPP